MIDTTLSSFERDVIEASMEVPVIVDFWAPWCEPCKVLGPLMERLEREYGGRFKLVNVNSDTNPELVSSFSLTSIPYAIAFVDAGRAWRNPEHTWDVGRQAFAVDGGIGLGTSEDNLRVYLAKNLQEPGSDWVVSVRLQRPF